jgi:hypothetical protein
VTGRPHSRKGTESIEDDVGYGCDGDRAKKSRYGAPIRGADWIAYRISECTAHLIKKKILRSGETVEDALRREFLAPPNPEAGTISALYQVKGAWFVRWSQDFELEMIGRRYPGMSMDADIRRLWVYCRMMRTKHFRVFTRAEGRFIEHGGEVPPL